MTILSQNLYMQNMIFKRIISLFLNELELIYLCYIAIYMNMRNVRGTFITYICNTSRIEHKNLEIRKHVTTSCSGTKPFY